MRFDTNLYEERQQWIHYIQLNEQGIPHLTNSALEWVGGVDGSWMTKSGSFAGEYGGPPPKFSAQQHIDYSNRRVKYGNTQRAKIAARIAGTGATTAVKRSLWSRAMSLLGSGAKLGSVIGVIDLFASNAGASQEMDWEEYYAEPEVTGGISDEDQATQDAIEAGTLDSGGNLPMGPFQDVKMYESYKNRNHNTCLREQFYGF